MEVLAHQDYKMNDPIGEMFQRLSVDIVPAELSMKVGLDHYIAASRKICVLCPASMFGMVLNAMLREILEAYSCLTTEDALVQYNALVKGEVENDSGLQLGRQVLVACKKESVRSFFERISDPAEAEEFMKSLSDH